MKNVFKSSVLAIGLLICNAGCKSPSNGYEHIKIKDIVVQTQADTISYGLGVLWATGIKKIGLKTIPSTFYIGAKDHFAGDTSLFTMESSDNYLKLKFEPSLSMTWPVNDANNYISELELKSVFDTIAYAIGFAWTNGVMKMGLTEITPALLLGLEKSLNGEETFLTYEAADKKLWAYIELQREAKWGNLKKEGEEWLAQNKLKEGVVSLPSGLQYKIIKNGNGLTPILKDVVECNYIGKLIDGSVFENTLSQTEPFKYFISGVKPGFAEATLLMKEGDKWELYVPYYLAYGSGGAGEKIPPYATLIYEIELLKVTKN